MTAWVQLVSALATLAIAGTALYQVREMRAARIAQQQPHVIVEADYSQRQIVKVVVRNIGLGSAKNINFKFSAPLESSITYPSDRSQKYIVSELPYFKDGLDHLAPGAEISCGWDLQAKLMQLLHQKGLYEGITVTSYYRDLLDNSYETTWTINPLQQAHAIDFDQKGLNELVKVAEKIQKKL